jgi:hypothetical protein
MRGLLSIKDFAKATGRNEFCVYKMVWAKRIAARKRRGRWVVPRHLVDEFRRRR